MKRTEGKKGTFLVDASPKNIPMLKGEGFYVKALKKNGLPANWKVQSSVLSMLKKP